MRIKIHKIRQDQSLVAQGVIGYANIELQVNDILSTYTDNELDDAVLMEVDSGIWQLILYIKG